MRSATASVGDTVPNGTAGKSFARSRRTAAVARRRRVPSSRALGRTLVAASVTAIGARGTAVSRFASSGFLVGGLDVSHSKGGMPYERRNVVARGVRQHYRGPCPTPKAR